MFNLGTLKINGQKVVRKVKLTEVPRNSYVILDEETGGGAKPGHLLYKDTTGKIFNLSTGNIWADNCNMNFDITFADVELNFSPVKDE